MTASERPTDAIFDPTPFGRVAIVHEFLNQMGGAERVVEEMLTLFPGVPVFTLNHQPERLPDAYRAWDVRTVPMVRWLPFRNRLYKAYAPLYPLAIEQLDLREFDLVLTSSYLFAHGVLTRADARQICYCHTPMRQGWDSYHFLKSQKGLLGRAAFDVLGHYWRMWDVSAAHRVDTFVANSETVRRRIHKYYRRDSTVVHPPVDVARFVANAGARENYYVVVTRLVPYKRVDLAVRACTRLGRTLVVVGRGPELARLRAMAGPTVRFETSLSDQQVADLLQRARGFLMPCEEDFGIAAVEAQAAGTPVLALARGGALESIVDGETGLLYATATEDGLVDAITRFEARMFDPLACRRSAERFDRAVFRTRFAEVLRASV